jgi:glycosyltransferase involved in cell wall biosynthesis
MKVAFDWGISSYYGWGVYGLNLALEWSKDPSIELFAEAPLDLNAIALDPLRKRALRPFIARSLARKIPPDAIRLHALGNELLPESDAPIGVIFFESPLSPAAIARARRYKLIITGSSWNEKVLRDAGVSNVHTILQGVDPSLCHPAPRRGLYPGKFLIFSGGKAEPRKGQDMVVKAFRIFAQKHPDAMLVAAWHSPWPQLAAGMDLDLSPLADRVVDVGAVPNTLMPLIYRECDVALFPNRAEGGTNLVAMECLACGVPAILSSNTGHRDLINRTGVFPLERQKPLSNGWFESDVEEMVEALEVVRRHCDGMNGSGHNPIADLTWSATATALADAIKEFST